MYYCDHNTEVIYHVATMMENEENNDQ